MGDFEGPHIAWRKSTASNSGSCVEVAVADGLIRIRDSANQDGVVLRFSSAVWSAFLAHARGKDSDLG